MIPNVDFLKSSPMIHKFGDLFNPPGLTNFMGVVHTEIDLTGISSLSFPPFSCANHRTATLFVNGRYFPSTGIPVTFTWFPDRIERTADYRGLNFRSVTVMPFGQMAVLIKLQITNTSGTAKKVDLRLGLNGGITRATGPWNAPLPPCEKDNTVQTDQHRNAVIFSARHSRAHMLQGAFPRPDRVVATGLEFSLKLGASESRSIYFVAITGDSVADLQSRFDQLAHNGDQHIASVRDEWNNELQAIFTPGNNRYSGSLPELETRDADILRIYVMSILGVVYFKRDNPASVYGRAYDTLMPKYWQSVTFIWDYALSSFVHALLDPEVMRKYLEEWMLLDIYHHFGTEYLTGGAVGYWYSANDFNMMVLINDYLRWTGNYKWLDKKIMVRGKSGKSTKAAVEYIMQYATSWQRLRSAGGLADYGEINNLLECVSSYIHEVASLNAANVYNMRTAAGMLNLTGKHEKSQEYLTDAARLLPEVLKLYADGRGYWRTRFPNGSMHDVQHCYDFFTILNTISEDLPETHKDEMVQFFVRELQTPAWMRALAPADSDAMYSERPDHQWNGAYPAWPAHSLKALYKIGKTDMAFDWLKGLARSFNQGPLGQAHFVDDVIDPEDGGARKAPYNVPYMTDWACSGGGSWVSVLIESIFGVKAELGGGISAQPQFSRFDPNAELHNLVYQGKKYNVSINGLKEI